MNFKVIISFLLFNYNVNAQTQILDKVIAIVGKNPLLLSEVETALLQKKENYENNFNKRCHTFEDLLFQKLLFHAEY